MENRNKELHTIFNGIANKDENEFNKLYKKYKSLVYAIVFSMLKNKEDSEEVVQTVFTKIWNIKKSNLPTNNEMAWLYNVAKNETINYLRKQKNTINIDDLYYINGENEELENIIDAEYYNNILSKLNSKDKEIVSLKILSSLSFREISQILNTPIGTVQWKYYKSLHTLKILMSNLTMFILTFTLYIKQKVSIKKLEGKNEENLKNETEENQQQVINKEESSNSISKDTEKLTNNIEEQKSSLNRGNNIQDIFNNENETESIDISNETIENVIVEKEIIVKTQNNTLFYISSIFLTLTIIFFAIWMKQKRRKSTK